MSELDAVHLPPSHASGEDPVASSSTHPAQPSTGHGDEIDEDDDAELEAMKARVAEMEAEAAKLREMQEQAEREAGGSSGGGGKAGGGGGGGGVVGPTDEEKEEVDARSVYVGNVDYGATPEEIQQHFASCGNINRVTILCDKFTGHPKGYAYVEFADSSLVANAMVLNESLFRGRLIKVTAKRTNLPGMNRGRGRGRGRGGFGRGGRGGRGRGRGRGGWY